MVCIRPSSRAHAPRSAYLARPAADLCVPVSALWRSAVAVGVQTGLLLGSNPFPGGISCSSELTVL